jgi:hypothetical protein
MGGAPRQSGARLVPWQRHIDTPSVSQQGHNTHTHTHTHTQGAASAAAG